MKISIATWNINSVRLRLRALKALAAEYRPHVICLQETKVADPLFPREAVREMGYGHQLIRGMKGYNGVAILSRLPFAESGGDDWCGRQDARHGWARITAKTGKGEERTLVVHNFYIPAGGDLPDPEANDKFAHKLQFLDELANWSRRLKRRGGKNAPSVLVGDLNVAPLETDVWSHRQLLNVVSHTPAETERLIAAQTAGAWVDAIRHFVPEDQKLYTWWSYRNRDWKKSDRGRRLDHVWVTPDLQEKLKGAAVLRQARDWTQPSDHVPVTVTLDL